MNLSKPDSQYSVGMKPVLYSELEAKETGTGWTRAGTEMTYFKDIKASEASWDQGEFEGVRSSFFLLLIFHGCDCVVIMVRWSEHDNLAPVQDPDKPSQYVMSFTMIFPHEGDTCYLAHCYPYRSNYLIYLNI